MRPFKSFADRALAHSLGRHDATLPTLDSYAASTLLRSPQGKAVELHAFPGQSTESALVIGGVHGTEPVGVDVTRQLVARLRAESGRGIRPFFTTLIVPALFPDNLPASHGGQGQGRRATRGRPDPNRQFPMTGTGLDPGGAPRDSAGRVIEPANVALIELIRKFEPRRIASVHAIGSPRYAGIYSDPHRGTNTASGHETADLARRMHNVAHRLGGHLPGSMRDTGQYPHQSEVNAQGVSLGEWASQAVPTGSYARDAIPVVTLELKCDWQARQARRRRTNVDAFMLAIRRVFLER